jgi:hypothetical protein
VKSIAIVALSVFICLLFASCKKNSATGIGNGSPKLSYGDSVFYVRGQSYEISPNITETGTYTAFPENLLIDKATGKITVAIMGNGKESQTGLRYKIKFQATGSNRVDSTYIVLAGINYLDKIYYLSQNDSIISPIYNADISKSLPSGTFGIQADSKLAINPLNGQINVKECIRRGLFDRPAENGEWEEVTITYKANDNSNSATNRIDIALYFYNTVNDIPSNVSNVMRAHQTMVLGVPQPAIPITTGPIDNDLPDNLAINRPRPPCIMIIGR